MPTAYPMSALENYRTGGGGQWAVEQDRRASCHLAVVTMRLAAGRRSMPDGLSRYLIIILRSQTASWVAFDHDQGTRVHWAFQATKLEACDLRLRQGASTVARPP